MVLLTALVSHSVWSNPSSSEIPIEKHSFETEASYIVFKDDSTVYMRNGSTGEIEWSSTDAVAVINAALGNLTSGRTNFEVVKFKNSFNIDRTITIPSYTRLDFTGAEIILPANNTNIGQWRGVFENEDQTNGNKFIEILGGTWRWMSPQSTDIHFFSIVQCENVKFMGLNIFGVKKPQSYNFGIALYSCTQFWITDCYFENCRESGAVIFVGSYGHISRNTFIDCHAGIFIDGLKYSEISENVVKYKNVAGTDGITIYRYCMHNTISNNAFHSIYTVFDFHSIQPNTDNVFVGNTASDYTTLFTKRLAARRNKYVNNEGINPFGNLATPFWTIDSENYVGVMGNSSNPTANVDYVVDSSDAFINSAGGTAVNMTIKDPEGNVIEDGLTTLDNKFIPYGYIINFGNFTVAPTVTVWMN